ncbi:hypothetical protein Smp_087750 [Schistosoma mansoni]|uniref:hypothetical protein n=1 Tax=Schistosoma mansoni TaxID=6183 RepID=UPI00019B355D|nr:hypothetical protein Smp_087750 [Schistosoma mansoni]|eukprot:XP_018645100.1 hypothetical protein Smp_087750 [Schistosoma mansoni]
MKCLVSVNPDPWITMEPGKHQQQQRKDLISKSKRSLSSELDTDKLKQQPAPLHHYPHHHGYEFSTNNTPVNNQSIAGDGCQNKTHLLIWDMEIFQLAKPIHYGVRFKRISGNQNAFKIIMKYFIYHHKV